MNDIYQRLQVAGEAQDQTEIIATLTAIQDGRLKNDLRLLNFYREVPVSYGAEVLTVEDHDAELQVNQIQAVVIAHEKLTVLKSSHFRRDVAAAVTYVNVEKSRVVLSNLGYALVRADRRMSVRVQLGSAIDASFAAPELDAVHGRLHDMSLTGMSINVARNPDLPISQKGELCIALPSGSITVAASLLKVIGLGDSFRLVFEIEPSRAAELSISQYIFQRQVEIIKELKDHPGVNN
ncbi:PilZ domain-containing protein [Geomonas sp. Red69]|uniref:PilZ domain-containing protein n=1 Tax=Geomonas diazotrophica TaxID=2843197 RepID=UPI001C111096|nr:PilZ domain-containing protein [Geomonas diazotrophica]MBU5638497.1 PilZ domain-containing protein [Geomonas diazotrophica]